MIFLQLLLMVKITNLNLFNQLKEGYKDNIKDFKVCSKLCWVNTKYLSQIIDSSSDWP